MTLYPHHSTPSPVSSRLGFGHAWYLRKPKPTGGFHLTPMHMGRASKATHRDLNGEVKILAHTPATQAPFIMGDCPITGFHWKALEEMTNKDPSFVARLLHAVTHRSNPDLIAAFETSAKKHLENYIAKWN